VWRIGQCRQSLPAGQDLVREDGHNVDHRHRIGLSNIVLAGGR
jgi:hypothetical protein